MKWDSVVVRYLELIDMWFSKLIFGFKSTERKGILSKISNSLPHIVLSNFPDNSNIDKYHKMYLQFTANDPRVSD